MVASGNDFVIIENRESRIENLKLPHLAKKICNAKYGTGADGLLVLQKSRAADVKMRIFNSDGSEAEMCGNGARCVALYKSHQFTRSSVHRVKLKIQTKAGIVDSEVNDDNVRIKLTEPKNIKLDIPLKINTRAIKVNFINTGVPHTVIFTEGLHKIDITPLGRFIRYHKKFSPRGTNVNLAEALNKNSLKVRTYERGVEDETLACGTGSVAAALIFALKTAVANKVYVHTQGKETLTVYFTKTADKFKNVWLEGKVKKVYEGVYYV